MKNRIYKFRAWDKKRKKMIDFSWFLDNEVCEMFDNEDLIVMQYTRLQDKNGKEIYEGDIIREDDDNLVVYFDEEALAYALKLKSKFYMGTLGSYLPSYIEVIGNIYENKNLLNNN